MPHLLANGNIQRTVGIDDDQSGVHGDLVVEIPPTDPNYEKDILWLPPDQAERARAILAEVRISEKHSVTH
jgi:hypothetical protein